MEPEDAGYILVPGEQGPLKPASSEGPSTGSADSLVDAVTLDNGNGAGASLNVPHYDYADGEQPRGNSPKQFRKTTRSSSSSIGRNLSEESDDDVQSRPRSQPAFVRSSSLKSPTRSSLPDYDAQSPKSPSRQRTASLTEAKLRPTKSLESRSQSDTPPHRLASSAHNGPADKTVEIVGARPKRGSANFIDDGYLNRGGNMIAKEMSQRMDGGGSKRSHVFNRSQNFPGLRQAVDRQYSDTEDSSLVDIPRDKGRTTNIALASQSVLSLRTSLDKPVDGGAYMMKHSGSVIKISKAEDWGRKLLPNLPVTMLEKKSRPSSPRTMPRPPLTGTLKKRSLPSPPPLSRSQTKKEAASGKVSKVRLPDGTVVTTATGRLPRVAELIGDDADGDSAISSEQEVLEESDFDEEVFSSSLLIPSSTVGALQRNFSAYREPDEDNDDSAAESDGAGEAVPVLRLSKNSNLLDFPGAPLSEVANPGFAESDAADGKNRLSVKRASTSSIARKSMAEVLAFTSMNEDDGLMMKPYPGATPKMCLDSCMKATEAFGQRNFGTMEFDNFNTAWYIRIKKHMDNTDMPQKIIRFMTEQLKYPLPRLLISVTGGAKDFELSSELEQVLKRGLRKAAEATNAWVMTGGSDCGIMKYVGQAMADIDSGMASAGGSDSQRSVRIPVIGTASWGVLAAQNELDKGGPHMNFTKHNNDTTAPPAQDVSLDKNHKVFLLYDDDSKGTFGTETRFRARFEETLVEMSKLIRPEDREIKRASPKNSKTGIFKSDKIFPVCLVVEGGPVTLKIVEEAIESNTPVVVIEGSGRMADVIAYAWRYLNDTSPESRYLTLSGLRSKIRRVIPQTSSQVFKKQVDVLKLVLQATQITIYSLEEDIREDQDIDGVDHALLHAILRSLKIKPVSTSAPNRRNSLLLKGLDRHSVGLYNMYQTKLFLSLMFNQSEAAQEHLMLLRSITRDAKSSEPRVILNTDLEDSLMWALTGQRSTFTKMLCPIVDIASMLQRDDCRSLDRIFNASNSAGSRDYLAVLYESAAKTTFVRSSDADGRLGGRLWCKRRKERETLYEAVIEENKKQPKTQRRKRSALDGSALSSWSTVSTGTGTNIGQHIKSFEDFHLVKVVNQLIGTVLLGKGVVQPNDIFKVIGRSIKDDTGRVSNAPQNKLKKDRAFQDLLVWAVITGRDDLASFFWKEGGNSISSALFASVLCQRLAMTQVLARHGHFRDIIEKLMAVSSHFEDLAIGVLDTCYKENTMMAQTILRLQLDHLHLVHHSPDFKDCIAMAFSGCKLDFISHPACLALIEREWMGDIDPQTSKLSVAITALFPFLLWQRKFFKIQFHGEAITSLFGELASTSTSHLINENPTEEEYEDDIHPSAERLGFWRKGAQRAINFYSAPFVKFGLDIISYLVLVCLYCYVLLHFRADKLATSEIVLLWWMAIVTIEEIGQAAAAGLRRWWREHWNKLDFLLYLMYWLAMAFRVTTVSANGSFFHLRLAKLLMALGAILLLGRILRFYLYSSILGPKIIMIMRMGSDIFAFLMMLIVAIMMYGVSTEALRPALLQDGDAISVWRLAYRPYFQIFGELYLDDINGETECIGEDPFSNCGSSLQWAIMLLSVVYLFITNIVLINLLIATMARKFEEVQAQAVKIWRYEQYDLLEEYVDKSKIPNPFSIISSLYDIYEGLKSFGKLPEEEKLVELGLEKELFFRQLESFQEKNTERFIDQREQQNTNSDSARVARLEAQTNIMRTGIRELHTQAQRLDNRIYRTHESITSVYRYLADQIVPLITQRNPIVTIATPRSNFTATRQSSDGATLLRRQSNKREDDDESGTDSAHFRSLSEAQMEDVTAALRGLSRQVSAYPASPDRLFSFRKPPKEDLLCYEIDCQTIYYFADEGPTKSHHPDDNIICMFRGELDAFYASNLSDTELQKPRNADGEAIVKVDIPSHRSSWETDWPEYDPPDYTAPYVYHFGPGSPGMGFKWAHDPDVSKIIVSPSSHEMFCEVAGPRSRPINPLGRVGIRGRGLLGKWGPNLAIDQVVTRWKRNENQIQVERRGRPILEVVLCKRADTGEWALPGGFQGMDDGVNPLIRKVFGLEPDTIQDNEDLQEVEAILKSSKLFYQGLTCDPRDTDNAWVESMVMHVHDDTNILSKYEMTEGSNPAIKFVSWATIHKDMSMFANHTKILEKIAEQMNALW